MKMLIVGYLLTLEKCASTVLGGTRKGKERTKSNFKKLKLSGKFCLFSKDNDSFKVTLDLESAAMSATELQ